MEEVVDYVEEESDVKPNEPLNESLPILSNGVNDEPSFVCMEETKDIIKTETIIKKPDVLPLQRNKRLFGALMGHLDSAKRLLEKDSLKIEQQVQTKSVAAEKHQQQSLKLAELHTKIKETEQNKGKN